MKATTMAAAASLLFWHGAIAAQQTATPEETDAATATSQETEAAEGIPATVHQEEATREIESELFEEIDKDGNGVISRQEAQGEPALADSWSQYDEDGDDTLNSEEFGRFTQSAAGEEAVARAEERSGAAEDMPATRHQEQAVEDDLVGQLDRNADGVISEDEAQADARLADNWDQYDENGDGRLDARELDRLEEELRDTEEAE